MATKEFSYKGKDVRIDEKGDEAVITIDDLEFGAKLHEGNLPMWSCSESYFMSPDLKGLAKHLADNLDILTSNWKAPSRKERLGVHDRDQEHEPGPQQREEAPTKRGTRQSRSRADDPDLG